MKIRVVLADDHQIMRDGLRMVLERDGKVEIVGEAATGVGAVETAARVRPDVVVVDVRMPDLGGADATRVMRQADPNLKIVALSASADCSQILSVLAAGAMAYVLKSEAAEELVRAIESVSRGRLYLSPMTAKLLKDKDLLDAHRRAPSPSKRLGRREKQVLKLLAEGRTSRQIAAALGISVRTVETHRRNVMQKLALRNVSEMTRFAIREGLVSAATES